MPNVGELDVRATALRELTQLIKYSTQEEIKNKQFRIVELIRILAVDPGFVERVKEML